jgi:hypothetical protein
MVPILYNSDFALPVFGFAKYTTSKLNKVKKLCVQSLLPTSSSSLDVVVLDVQLAAAAKVG